MNFNDSNKVRLYFLKQVFSVKKMEVINVLTRKESHTV